MAKEFQKQSMFIEQNPDAIESGGDFKKELDDDGHPKRSGTY